MADNFYTTVIQNDPRFNIPSRIDDTALLEPVLRERVPRIIDDARAHGMELMVYETYRSLERQQELFEKGSSLLCNNGVHHFGLACDLVKNIGGEPSWKGDFSLLGVLAQAYGLIWGGDWGTPNIPHKFIDEVHVQRCSVTRQAALFALNWYPDSSYDPYSQRFSSLV